jgi:hypothetical protein
MQGERYKTYVDIDNGSVQVQLHTKKSAMIETSQVGTRPNYLNQPLTVL